MSKRIVIAHLLWEGKDYLVHTLAEGERPVELTALCREKETLLGNIYVGRGWKTGARDPRGICLVCGAAELFS